LADTKNRRRHLQIIGEILKREGYFEFLFCFSIFGQNIEDTGKAMRGKRQIKVYGRV
jgi:hypothetical protein